MAESQAEALSKHGLRTTGFVMDCVYPGCNQQFRFTKPLYDHIRGHREFDTDKIQCPHCGLERQSFTALVLHARSHSDSRPYICPFTYCHFKTKAKGSLKSHLMTTHKGRVTADLMDLIMSLDVYDKWTRLPKLEKLVESRSVSKREITTSAASTYYSDASVLLTVTPIVTPIPQNPTPQNPVLSIHDNNCSPTACKRRRVAEPDTNQTLQPQPPTNPNVSPPRPTTAPRLISGESTRKVKAESVEHTEGPKESEQQTDTVDGQRAADETQRNVNHQRIADGMQRNVSNVNEQRQDRSRREIALTRKLREALTQIKYLNAQNKELREALPQKQLKINHLERMCFQETMQRATWQRTIDTLTLQKRAAMSEVDMLRGALKEQRYQHNLLLNAQSRKGDHLEKDKQIEQVRASNVQIQKQRDQWKGDYRKLSDLLMSAKAYCNSVGT